MAVLLSDSTYENLMRIANKVDSLGGDGVSNDYHNIRILAQRTSAPVIQQQQRAAQATFPTGQYQYMIYQMVAQRQAGFDFARGHPLI